MLIPITIPKKVNGIIRLLISIKVLFFHLQTKNVRITNYKDYHFEKVAKTI
jgi:hypothetical protein